MSAQPVPKTTDGSSADLPLPAWVAEHKGGFRIIDSIFVEDYCERNRLRCINDAIYNIDGRLDDRAVKSGIQPVIKPWCDANLAGRAKNLFEAVRNECYCEAPPIKRDRIHCRDGTLRVGPDGTIACLPKEFAINRLDVSCDLRAGHPERWLSFLNDLLEPDDILTLQEYLGYCLIPTTRAQTMLFLIGQGGEGKSRIGVVLSEIFRSSAIVGKLQNIQEDRFAGATLENRLLFIDDDLKGSKLKDTDFIKSVITAESPMQVQRKGIDLYSADLYCRLIAFGNQALSSMFDRSDGFYRRQLILMCRKFPKSRIPDTDLSRKLIAEKQEIFVWMVNGLQRLVRNGFRFTRSVSSLSYMEQRREEDNNVIAFLKDQNCVEFAPVYDATSREIYDCYLRWCSANADSPLSERTVLGWMKENADGYHLKFSTHIIRSGRKGGIRGYKGIRVLFSEGFSV